MNWPTTLLADECELITKGTTPTTLGFAFQDKGVGFLRVQNIRDGKVNYDTDTLFIDERTHAALERSQIRAGDVLVSIAGTIGRAGVVPENAPSLNCNQALAIVRARPSLCRTFLRHWLESTNAQTQMRGATVTGTIANLSLGQIGKLLVPLPALSEQRRIAEVLDRAEALRTKRRAALALLDTLTQSIFLNVLTDSTSPTKSLGEVAEILTGYPFRSAEYVESGKGLNLCRGANVMPGRIDWADRVCWPTEKAAGMAEFELAPNDIVLAMDRPWISEGFKLAQIQASDCPALLVQRVARIRGKGGIANEFLFHALKQPAFARHCRPTETTIPHISPKEIRSYELPIPPVKLQHELVRRIAAVEKLKSAQRASLAELDALFASLQHRAFRGEL